MVEMVVAVGLFTTFMLLIVGSFLTVTDAARKARSTRIALDNVSSALDYMAREIRLGNYFRCEDGNALTGVITTVRNCPYPTGGQYLAFERAGGSLALNTDQIVFRVNGGVIERSTQSGVNPEALTAPEINIQEFRFYVDGVTHAGINPANADQPRITLVIRGLAGGTKVKAQVPFSIQTTLSARTPNIPPS